MKAALVVHRVTRDIEHNVCTMLSAVQDAARAEAELILFAEMASTGFINGDDPERDRAIAEPIPGPTTDRLAVSAREHGAWIGAGMFERDDPALYDSAVLIDPTGRIRLTYRRMQPNWRTRDADPDTYRLGDRVTAAETPFGRVAFLLCGDLFDDDTVDRLRAQQPDLLLFPFARCFNDGAYDQRRWDEDELPEYLARVRRARVRTLMANYIADPELDGGSFGGAMDVAADGTLRSSLALGVVGALRVDL
ncbi:carbon-nitrogen hydrolase family protein [Candidatus Poribacteria bacterium]|nr:carbon-nitrogen hydrolase family protein [Candidatus Poribacteria bacterium]